MNGNCPFTISELSSVLNIDRGIIIRYSILIYIVFFAHVFYQLHKAVVSVAEIQILLRLCLVFPDPLRCMMAWRDMRQATLRGGDRHDRHDTITIVTMTHET